MSKERRTSCVIRYFFKFDQWQTRDLVDHGPVLFDCSQFIKYLQSMAERMT